MVRVLRLLFVIVFALYSAGCYSWYDVKPAELPKLNGSYQRVTGSVSTPTGTSTVVERTVAHVEKPDGTLTEIKGEYDLRLATRQGEFLFQHPVNSELKDTALSIRSSNRAVTAVALRDIRKAEVSQYDTGMTILAATAVGLLAVGAAILLLESGRE